ncbi:UNVERIFIED_CONTAM: hypothetical protein Slati_4464600 [Sesamum latifolium]|uniref:Retrovirus-related Pol polyprotein from transposon TNT 1-94-like beta-barrel domain-containing protein n=1 Tax=Sesamum latifolium TaxID=2727402 RepID=A0AAW2SSD8_9LAMI
MAENQPEVSTANTSTNRSRQVVKVSQPPENTDGRSVRPADDSDELDEWIRTDYMVITWILNTVSKEIVHAFIYVFSARNLWLELEARYGGSNRPMIYNLEREIASVSQGEIQIIKREDSRQLMRFLMRLNNTYEHVRSQILLMEPRPHVQKAFSMVLSVEKQLSVQVQLSVGTAGAIYQVHHKDMKHKGIDISSILHTEVRKLMNESAPSHPEYNTPFDDVKINFAHWDVEESTGKTYCFNDVDYGSWIVVSGATRHVYANLKYFTNYFTPSKPTRVSLPDGSKQLIAHIGTVKPSPHITLEHVLYIPTFSVNLFSVSQLC